MNRSYPVWHWTVQCHKSSTAPTVDCSRTLPSPESEPRAYSACPVAHRTVRCAHRQQSSPTAIWWLRAINTPNHHHTKHPSILNIAFNTRAIDSTPKHNQSDRSTQSPQINSSALGLVRGSLVFICCSCLLSLAFFFFSILTLKCFVSKARDTNYVVVLARSK